MDEAVSSCQNDGGAKKTLRAGGSVTVGFDGTGQVFVAGERGQWLLHSRQYSTRHRTVDPELDRTIVFSTGQYAPLGLMLLVNGTPQPDPLVLRTGTQYRFRFINITRNDMDLRVRLVRKDVPMQWRVVAKDGADLPPAQLKFSTAEMGVPVGST